MGPLIALKAGQQAWKWGRKRAISALDTYKANQVAKKMGMAAGTAAPLEAQKSGAMREFWKTAGSALKGSNASLGYTSEGGLKGAFSAGSPASPDTPPAPTSSNMTPLLIGAALLLLMMKK